VRKLCLLLVVLIASALAATASSHNFSAHPGLTIHKVPVGATAPGTRIIIYGRIVSARVFCRANRVVRLFRVRPGPDRLLALDRTDREGEYRFARRPRRDQTVYTRIRPRSAISYGHSHSCTGARSRNRFINVS
jgi:hypothetical protein